MSSPDEKTPEQPPAEAPAPEADAGASQVPDAESRLDIAKRFLEEASVKDSPREKKVEFLRSKEITDEEIESLLGKEPVQQPTSPAEVRLPSHGPGALLTPSPRRPNTNSPNTKTPPPGPR